MTDIVDYQDGECWRAAGDQTVYCNVATTTTEGIIAQAGVRDFTGLDFAILVAASIVVIGVFCLNDWWIARRAR